MAYIILETGQNGYRLISVPEQIAPRAYEYQMAFDRWLMDRNNDHGYWHLIPGDEDAPPEPVLCYDPPEAFVKWLNGTVLADSREKAAVLPGEVPVLHF